MAKFSAATFSKIELDIAIRKLPKDGEKAEFKLKRILLALSRSI